MSVVFQEFSVKHQSDDKRLSFVFVSDAEIIRRNGLFRVAYVFQQQIQGREHRRRGKTLSVRKRYVYAPSEKRRHLIPRLRIGLFKEFLLRFGQKSVHRLALFLAVRKPPFLQPIQPFGVDLVRHFAPSVFAYDIAHDTARADRHAEKRRHRIFRFSARDEYIRLLRKFFGRERKEFHAVVQFGVQLGLHRARNRLFQYGKLAFKLRLLRRLEHEFVQFRRFAQNDVFQNSVEYVFVYVHAAPVLLFVHQIVRVSFRFVFKRRSDVIFKIKLFADISRRRFADRLSRKRQRVFVRQSA